MADAGWGDVNAAREQAQSASKSALEFSAGGASLADELRKAIGERFNQSPVAQQAATARGNFLQAAPQARLDVANLIQGGAILSPAQQQQIQAEKRAAALVPVMGANVMQEAGFGTLEDLINAGTNAWNAQAQMQQGMAGLAQGNYKDMLNELVTRGQQGLSEQELLLKKQQLAQQALQNPLELALKKAQIDATNRSNQTQANQPTKYPFSEPYISLGLSGKQVSTIGDKLIVEYQKGVNQTKGATTGLNQQNQQLQNQKLNNELNPEKPWWQFW